MSGMEKRGGAAQQAGAATRFRLRERHDGWTAMKRKVFLRALSETGCVRQACARVGISSTSAYRYRRLDPMFARAWQMALSRMQPQLEHAAYERAVEGWEEPIVQGGKVVATRRRYSDSLLRLLIQRGFRGEGSAPVMGTPAEMTARAQEAAALAGGHYRPGAAEHEGALERLRAKLTEMHERLTAEP